MISGITVHVHSVITTYESGSPHGLAPFKSPHRIIGVWPSPTIPSDDSINAGYLTILQGLHKHSKTNSGTTRLEVGPREARTGSRVPIHTSSSPVVQATCQDGAVHAPESPLRGSTHPRTSGSPMLHVGGRHGRVAAMPMQERKHHAPRW